MFWSFRVLALADSSQLSLSIKGWALDSFFFFFLLCSLTHSPLGDMVLFYPIVFGHQFLCFIGSHVERSHIIVFWLSFLCRSFHTALSLLPPHDRATKERLDPCLATNEHKQQ